MRFWPWLLPALCLCLFVAGCGRSDYSKHVELVADTDNPSPAMTFALRFDSPMISGDAVGLQASNSPLVIQPALAGTFTWLSPRSGVFTPKEPLALDTRYDLSLSHGLLDAAGHPSAAVLRCTFKTPSFGVTAAAPNLEDTNAYSEPVIRLAFNANVRAADATSFLCFRDARGDRIPATVRLATRGDLWGEYEVCDKALHAWTIEAEAMRRPPETNAAPSSESATNESPNALVVTPEHPLTVGKKWRLQVASGIPAADLPLKSREQMEIPIGDINPFAICQVSADNYVYSGPFIQLDFTKPVPQTLTNDFRDWIELSELPSNAWARVYNNSLKISGDFKGGTVVKLKLRSGFAAAEHFTLPAETNFLVTIPHVAPRLYFPAFSCDQLAGGKRSLPLLAVNVTSVVVRAKWMDPAVAIHALRGYRSYFNYGEYGFDAPPGHTLHQQIDYNVLPGVTLCSKTIDLGADADNSDRARTIDLNWDELLKGRRAGVAFIEAQAVGAVRGPAPGTQAIIQLTDLGLSWKRSPAGVDVFAFSYQSGLPVAGAAARLADDENQTLQEVLTDTNGLAHLAINTNAEWLCVQSGDDFHAQPLGENCIWRYQFGLPTADFQEGEKPRRTLLFSDRDLYRPGESMHLEAIIRDWGDRGLTIPAGAKGDLECVDARDQVFFRTNAVFSPMGSWSTLVPLTGGPRGDYSARLYFGSNNCTTYAFQVRDFKPASFEVALRHKPAYAAAESVEIPVTARYLFGKALSNARVNWWVQAEDTVFQPEKFPNFAFGHSEVERKLIGGRSALQLNGRGMLNTASNFVIAPAIPANPVAPQPRSVEVRAQVTDLNQQWSFQSADFICHSSDFYLGLSQGAEVLSSNQPPPLEIVALGTDGKPWPRAVKAQLTLQRVTWQDVNIQGAGRIYGYRNDPILTNVLEQEIVVEPVSLPGGDEAAKGNRIAGLPPLPAGEYLAKVSATDDSGRPMACSLDFEVSAPAQVAWNYRNEVLLTLKPDRKEYAPGDTAEVLVQAPFSGTALVTVEREKVLRSFVARLEGNAPSIRIPLEPSDAPNVFVSVMLLRGAADSPHHVREPEYRIGCCNLPVSDPRNRLAVEIQPASTNNLPGRPVEVAVRLTDAAQKPVAGAEVVLYAVDDGILGMTGYKLPDPYSLFYADRSLAVQTSISLPSLLTEDPAAMDFRNKGYLVGGAGGGMERVRKNFLACAFWNATLTSDADGLVHARFTAPDSLTRYRLFAVAHTADSRFGGSQSFFQVSKPLAIEPALPQIANVTDHLVARGVVLNQTTNAGEVIITLELDGRNTATNAGSILTRRVSVPANGSVAVEFPVEFTDTGDSKWLWRARFADPAASDFADAVQSVIPVGHIAPVISEVLLSHSAESRSNFLSEANPQLLAGHGTITVSLANTRLNELGETAARLLHYPYGCAEQTGSSLLPWILLRDSRALPLDYLGVGTNNAGAAIRAGVERLFTMQTRDGGLAYWPREADPMLWASAYGGMVLGIARQHGVTVPEADFEALLKYLSEQMRSVDDNEDTLSDKCLALYALALAGRAEPAYHETLYAQRGKLSGEDRALLALAILESKGSAEMAAGLLKTGHGRASHEQRFGCPARETAIRLLAWMHYRPGDPTVDTLVTDLMHDQQHANWDTTQGNAWALLALTDYARLVETGRPAATGRLSYGNQTVEFRLDAQTNAFTHSFTIETNAGLTLVNDSTNVLYTSIKIEARPPEVPQPRQDRGISLQRRYDRLDDLNHAQDLTGLSVGDRVLVTLRLTVREPAEFVVIDDALPCILEAVNPEFRTQDAQAAALPDKDLRWESNFREIRKDRCLSFADDLEPGTYVLRYVARVRAAGTVTAPPAKAEEMYHPERCGLTESQVLTSEPLK